MIEFRVLPNDNAVMAHSPLLRAAQLTLQYTQDHGSIPLTPSKAFKRVFVHWAAEHFDWPNMGYDDLFSVNKVLNEYDFPPLELVHFLLIELKLARHYKGQFKITKRGLELLANPSQLLNTLLPFYIFNIDHSAYSRSGEQALGTWDVWFNVLNVEAENTATELELYEVFYGKLSDAPMAWRATSAFYSCVLRPMRWAGLLLEHKDQGSKRSEAVYLKTPLWPAWLQLDTDDIVELAQRH
ncbi:hypothetical protein NIG5292_02365 [Nereida ignava]|jgi:hypothetical protein|uniref:Uncharacterized protein n=2 Tax=Nereida ignava TaxID=282199 RepID=A0A0U1NNL7_9RHOB|nr:hypothetical protein [Nereida ignava]CRK76308.1 hypothetical protein NIG5292_02365 [Nereida ignava]SFJ81294.1 hypothetical protein SAMN02745667_02445 [Nereida ignava DSM 16309]